MKALIWIIILFAVAAGLAIVAQNYPVIAIFIFNNTYALRMNVITLILILLALWFVLYILIRFARSITDVPGKIHRFSVKRTKHQAELDLNDTGVAFFEGRYDTAQKMAEKLLDNKYAGEKRTLALIFAAYSADAAGDDVAREKFLEELKHFPEKDQLPRFLLMADKALLRKDYSAAENHIQTARKINQNLHQVIRLELRHAIGTQQWKDVLKLSDKLLKKNALDKDEADHYHQMAYLALLKNASTPKEIKKIIKKIPDDIRVKESCAEIAENYQRMGMYKEAVAWVKKYYPENHDAALLPILIKSSSFLKESEQHKTLEQAEEWLKDQSQDADLLMALGQMAYEKKLWGKAQSYLEASLSVRDSVPARLTLAKIFSESGKEEAAEEQQEYALKLVEDNTENTESDDPE